MDFGKIIGNEFTPNTNGILNSFNPNANGIEAVFNNNTIPNAFPPIVNPISILVSKIF